MILDQLAEGCVDTKLDDCEKVDESKSCWNLPIEMPDLKGNLSDAGSSEDEMIQSIGNSSYKPAGNSTDLEVHPVKLSDLEVRPVKLSDLEVQPVKLSDLPNLTQVKEEKVQQQPENEGLEKYIKWIREEYTKHIELMKNQEYKDSLNEEIRIHKVSLHRKP